MTKAFTLLELLLVMALMGLMGTVAVGGYRGMQRGMEERGVMQNVNEFLKSAYSRAQIDRLPVVVYLWNETVQLETQNKDLVVVGHAVAVRPFGRLSGVQGNYLYDEYGDLSANAGDLETGNGGAAVVDSAGNSTYIYKIDSSTSPMRRSIISQTTVGLSIDEPIFGCKPPAGDSNSGGGGTANLVKMPVYCYVKSSSDNSGVQWKTGDAYGFEFQELVLPHNYTFGKAYSQSETAPIQNLPQIPRFFPGENSGSGSDGEAEDFKIDVYALRPNSAGEMTPNRIGKSKDPRERNGI